MNNIFDEDGNLIPISPKDIVDLHENLGYSLQGAKRELKFQLLEDAIDELEFFDKISKELSQVLRLTMEMIDV
jgi:hypothetical protein